VYDILQLSPGTMRSRLFLFTAPGVELNGATCNLPFRSTGTTRGDASCVTWVLDCPSRAFMNGRPVGRGTALVWRPGSYFDGQFPAGFRWVTLQSQWDALPAATAALLRRWPWRTTLLAAPLVPAQRRRIAQALDRMGAWGRPGSHEVAAGPGREWRARWLGWADEAVREASPLLPPKGRTWRATLNVRAAERWLRARIGEPVYVKDLCRSLGLPERTLQDSFRSTLGMGPMAFLEMLRLHGVYRTLRAPGADSVSEVARRFGLTHASRFSSRFRAVFGTTPREALRSARGNAA
jgi:AraC-like DNA-binding protein